jgi:hypothetical protein
MLEWLQNPYVVIAVAIGAMFFGYFFGLVEGRGQGYKRRQAEEGTEAEKEVVEETKAEPLPPASPALAPDETSLLDVSSDRAGQLRLKVDGERIETPTLTPEQRKRVIAILTQVRPWLEAPASPASVSKPAPPATPVRPAPAPEARPSTPPRPAPPPAKEEEEAGAAPGSIVAQIDAILQTQVQGTPLMEKGIRLHESPEGGVLVLVGIDKYEAIDDVPDDQIKMAIRRAITTWENTYTPGL